MGGIDAIPRLLDMLHQRVRTDEDLHAEQQRPDEGHRHAAPGQEVAEGRDGAPGRRGHQAQDVVAITGSAPQPSQQQEHHHR
ncbi:hypothetical protein D7V80_04985 [Corallococcus sp. CA054B]|nr:hypothetical protein D7V80_04985 [Corallococcus sp. CA054B]